MRATDTLLFSDNSANGLVSWDSSQCSGSLVRAAGCPASDNSAGELVSCGRSQCSGPLVRATGALFLTTVPVAWSSECL